MGKVTVVAVILAVVVVVVEVFVLAVAIVVAVEVEVFVLAVAIMVEVEVEVMMRTIDELRSRFKGQDVWVIGNGPSFAQVDPGTIPQGRTIGVNRILKPPNAYTPAYLLMMDFDVWKQEIDRIFGSRCKLISGETLYEHPEVKLRPAYVFQKSKNVEPGGSTGPLFNGYVTGYYAAEIASRMVRPGGRVVLAGMDLEYPDEGPTHSFGDGKEFGCRPARFAEGISAFIKLRSALKGVVEFRIAGFSKLLSHGFLPLPQAAV